MFDEALVDKSVLVSQLAVHPIDAGLALDVFVELDWSEVARIDLGIVEKGREVFYVRQRGRHAHQLYRFCASQHKTNIN